MLSFSIIWTSPGWIILLLGIVSLLGTEGRSGWTQGALTKQPLVNLADIPCGGRQSSSGDRGRIIGGTSASEGEFPWLISLQDKGGAHFCGGVILDRFHIATAAHCFIFQVFGEPDSVLRDTVIVAGTRDTGSGTRHELSRVVIHPGFSHFYPNFANDLALIRLKTGLEWGANIQPACLRGQDKGNEVSPQLGWVAGWGVQSKEDEDGGVLRDGLLKRVALPLWSNEECQAAYSAAGVDWATRDSHLCAGTRDGSRDSCNGDSGSALFTGGREPSSGRGVMVAEALVSGGEGCSSGIPGIYTRLSSFLPWIRDNIRND